MSLVYDVFYYWPSGKVCGGVDNAVSDRYVRQIVARVCREDHNYAVATNLNGDGHKLYYGPNGETAHAALPWVIRERKEAAEREHQRNKALLNRGYAIMRQHGVRVAQVDHDQGTAFIRVGSLGLEDKWIDIRDVHAAATQEDNGDGRVPLYRAIRHAIAHHGRDDD